MAEAQPGQVQGANIKAPIFTFRDNVKDFARPNLFQVEVFAPPVLQDSITPQPGGVTGSTAQVLETAAGGSQLNAASANAFGTFLVKAANIPASVVGVVNVPYRGRQLKIAGDRTFEPWTVTVLNDQSFKFRAFFEAGHLTSKHYNKTSKTQILLQTISLQQKFVRWIVKETSSELIDLKVSGQVTLVLSNLTGEQMTLQKSTL